MVDVAYVLIHAPEKARRKSYLHRPMFTMNAYYYGVMFRSFGRYLHLGNLSDTSHSVRLLQNSDDLFCLCERLHTFQIYDLIAIQIRLKPTVFLKRHFCSVSSSGILTFF